MSAYVVGLTGGIGSGKSTVTEFFAALGVAVVDTDAIAHELTAAGGPAIPAIRSAFGEQVILPSGAMDRVAMRQRVFAEPALRQTLENILHPLIRQISAERCRAAVSPYVVLAVPLLVESGNWRGRCDRVLVVDCPETLQVARVMARSALSEVEVSAILAAQASRAERLAVADDVLLNDGDKQGLPGQVEKLHRSYLELAMQKVE